MFPFTIYLQYISNICGSKYPSSTVHRKRAFAPICPFNIFSIIYATNARREHFTQRIVRALRERAYMHVRIFMCRGHTLVCRQNKKPKPTKSSSDSAANAPRSAFTNTARADTGPIAIGGTYMHMRTGPNTRDVRDVRCAQYLVCEGFLGDYTVALRLGCLSVRFEWRRCGGGGAAGVVFVRVFRAVLSVRVL